MKNDDDLYEILGVEQSADEKTIKSAFRAQAVLHHPDQNPEGGEDHFRKLREARDRLLDPVSRESYDACRREACDEEARQRETERRRASTQRPSGVAGPLFGRPAQNDDLVKWQEPVVQPEEDSGSNAGWWLLAGVAGVAGIFAASRFAPVDAATGRHRDRKSGKFRKGYIR